MATRLNYIYESAYSGEKSELELAQEYVKELKATKSETYVLEPWEEEVAKWEWTRPLLTKPSSASIAKLREWAGNKASSLN